VLHEQPCKVPHPAILPWGQRAAGCTGCVMWFCSRARAWGPVYRAQVAAGTSITVTTRDVSATPTLLPCTYAKFPSLVQPGDVV
jgi:hypothetical protein